MIDFPIYVTDFFFNIRIFCEKIGLSMKKSIQSILLPHHTANKFLIDFFGFCRSQVWTLLGKIREKMLKFLAVGLVSSITLRLLN